jgi:hypothetical protein
MQVTLKEQAASLAGPGCKHSLFWSKPRTLGPKHSKRSYAAGPLRSAEVSPDNVRSDHCLISTILASNHAKPESFLCGELPVVPACPNCCIYVQLNNALRGLLWRHVCRTSETIQGQQSCRNGQGQGTGTCCHVQSVACIPFAVMELPLQQSACSRGHPTHPTLLTWHPRAATHCCCCRRLRSRRGPSPQATTMQHLR